MTGQRIAPRRTRTIRWRRVLLAALASGWLLAYPTTTTLAHTCVPDPSVGVAGRLLVPRASGIGVIPLPDRASQTVAIAPSQGVSGGVALSPDGSVLAVPRFWRPPTEKVGGQDILFVKPDGGEPVSTIARSQPGEAVGSPTWLPDSSLVFERRQLNDGPDAVRIERARPGQDAQAPALVTIGASWPSASPDGSLLAMVRTTTTDRLVVMQPDGSDERVLLDEPDLITIAFPRFSPDGKWVAFTAASDPGADPTVRPTPSSRPAAQAAPAERPLSWTRSLDASSWLKTGTATVRAHGLPWDVWMIKVDGSGLRRVTAFQDDDSSLAWSPDGRHIATLSAEAMHVVSIDGRESYCITAEGGYGGFVWLP